MFTRADILSRLESEGLSGRCWGAIGQEAVERIEQSLGLRLGPELRDFAVNIGNLMLSGTNLLITGDEAGLQNCVTETLAMRDLKVLNKHPEKMRMIMIMDDSGESFWSRDGSDVIECFDTTFVMPGEIIRSFPSFTAFLEWVIAEAKRIRDAPRLW